MSNLLSIITLQAAGGSDMFGFLMPMALIFVIMYFLIFRPQAKKQKKHQEMLSTLKKGDKVVTAGGIHGSISGVKEKEQTLIIKIDDNVKVEIGRGSVSRKLD